MHCGVVALRHPEQHKPLSGLFGVFLFGRLRKAPPHRMDTYWVQIGWHFLVNGLQRSVQRRLCILHRADTQFTCFTSATVLVQKYKYWCGCVALYGAYSTAFIINLLALLVQKYKY